MKAYIASTGSYLPNIKVINADFKQFPASAIPLIEQKTGIRARYHCGDLETTSTLAVNAGKACLEKIGYPADQLDAVILSTSTPDRLIPATATKVAHTLGALRAFAFDVNSVCSGGVVLLEVARSLIISGAAKNVLVIAADSYSKFLNPSDFTTTPYFGDGAGAVLVSSEHGNLSIGCAIIHSDGSGYETITIKAGAGEMPIHKSPEMSDCFFRMNGRAVFGFATEKGSQIIQELLAKRDLSASEVTQFILHQANINILKAIATNLDAKYENFYSNLHELGNTASASVFIALDDYLSKQNTLERDSIIALASFGGGLTWGACLLDAV